MSALQIQTGGNHYKDCAIQPIEFIHANSLDYFQGNIIKYATRHKSKNGAEDLRKVIHYAQLALELQYGQKLEAEKPKAEPLPYIGPDRRACGNDLEDMVRAGLGGSE